MTFGPRRRLVAGALLLAACLTGPVAGAGTSARIEPRLRAEMDQAGSTPLLAWVYLRDKGRHEPRKAALSPNLVSARSLHRRAKVRAGALVDRTDLPLDDSYVNAVAAHVRRVRQRSKWFNAVSVLATREQLEALRSLACVQSIESLTRYRRADAAVPGTTEGSRLAPGGPVRPHSLDYGRALPQVALINVPALHDQGLDGTGVWIGHFDNGHRLLSHQVFTSLQVVAAYDFVDNDPDPAPPAEAPDYFGAHGIATLSVLGAFAPGFLIGPAYGASFVLARTENDASETPLEEDNWVRAIEWADSLGIDIASTSLGYTAFDVPYPAHTWEDMDGNTTLITRAADLAVARGIVVVNAAGNDGFNASHNTLVAPADGDSVIAVGGVWPDSTRYTTSSVGPAASQPPRIKPDVMALGAAVWIAGTGSTTHYGQSAGTSLACPLVAGVAALLLQACPSATPMQIRDVLRQTASERDQPDNNHGWGVINATAALAQLRTAIQPASLTDVKGLYR